MALQNWLDFMYKGEARVPESPGSANLTLDKEVAVHPGQCLSKDKGMRGNH